MEQGFFKELDIKRNIIKKPIIKSRSNILSCESCKLHETCLSPKMEPTGKNRKKILILAEVPGKTEDEENIQLIGKSGQLLRRVLKELGYFLDRDFIKTNAIICRPPSNRTPKTKEINCCRHHLFETIEKYNPKVIIPMGDIALQSLLGLRIKGVISEVKYSNWVGEIIPDQELKKYICPIYHPSYVLRNEFDKVLVNKWKQHLKNAIETADKPLYVHNYNSDVIIIKDMNEAIEIMDKYIKDRKTIAYDYETNGIKPHREGHKIVCTSFSDGMFSYSFPFFNNEHFKEKWKRLISSSRSYCIAQNDRFEEMWNDTILGFKTGNWVWDTMIGQSILNNKKVTKLKFWVYIRFGVLSYDQDVDVYIKKEKKGEDTKSDNRFNRIEECELDKLLLYNGLDSLFECKIYEMQKNEFDSYLEQGMNLFMDGFQKLLIASQNGIRIDIEKMYRYENEIKEKLEILKKEIYESEEVKKWDKEEKFDFKSNNDLKHFIYDCLGVRIQKRTKNGAPSLDHSALEKVDIPITRKILEYRRWDKALSTYIMQYKREEINGFIHPFFNLGVGVKTYRSSSSGPNFQNIPKRDEEVKKIIRNLIIPRKRNKLIEYDFKGMEVSGAASIFKDPNLIAYLLDDSKDMHRDMAEIIFIMKNTDPYFKKYKLRYIAKNGFVFPSFYGSTSRIFKKEHEKIGAGDITLNIWEKTDEEVKEYLKDNGILNIKDFQKHMERIEDDFWNERFPVYAEGKRKMYREYEKNGYIELPTGFRCQGPMKYNEVINYSVQGPSFHILLWTFNRVQEEMGKFKNSFLIGQIHDSILGDIHPDDEKKIDYLVWYYGTQKIRDHFNWINVPLKIEKESSEVDGSWANMTERGFLKGEK